MLERTLTAASPVTSRQKTLKSSIHCTGIGLHSGDKVSMTLHPAAADTGIRFKRTDIAGQGAVIPARYDHVVDTKLCTVIGNGQGITIGTVEHLMAAFAGCGIDNALVEVNGGEVPIMDGSAAPFVFLIECAGIAEQAAARPCIEILKPVVVEDGDRRAALYPAPEFSVAFTIDFESPAVAHQEGSFTLQPGRFKAELARARTFGFEHEVCMLRAAGLARGGSLDNAVVVSGERILNEGGLRYQDEFVRHKILDSIGDLALAGATLHACFEGLRSGHALNNRLLRALFADPTAWRLTTEDAAVSLEHPLEPRRAIA